MEHVAGELVMKAVPYLGLEAVPVLEGSGRLEPVLVLRQHVGHVDIRPGVVIDVRDVEPHRRQADVGHLLLEPLGEAAVALVDVQIISLEEVVRDVDVRPAVAVHVAHDDAQTQADLAPEDAGLPAHVHEVPAVVAIQPGAAERVAHVACVLQRESEHRPGRVIDHEEVEIPVAVIVEERGLGRVAGIRDAVGGRLLDERRDTVGVEPLVQVELVRPELSVRLGDASGVTDVDVEPAVAVHVGEGDAGRPPLAVQPGLGGDVAEVELPLVQVQPRAALIRREHDLREAVAGEVAERDAAAVVVVAIGEDVQVAGVGEAVLEADAGVARGQQGEETAVGRGRGAGRHFPGGPARARAPGEQARS